MESSISRADRLFLEQRVPEKPWPTSFRDNVGNTRALPMNNDVPRPCVTFIISLFYAAAISPTLSPPPVSLSLLLLFSRSSPRPFSKYVYTRVYYANFSRVRVGGGEWGGGKRERWWWRRRTLTKPINLAATLKFLVSGYIHVPGHSAGRESRDGN